MTTELDFRSANALWASVLVETLVRAGVCRAVVSPGSRSTPLTIALARQPAFETVPVLDERSAAFFALGQAKALLEPVVLVCTSGTAAANYFPAVIEAHESGVPLVVITADRPPELRACGSGQTIDQQKLYGGYVRFFHELAVPALDEALFRYLRQTVLHAVARAHAPFPGPVHLNAPFRDPLPPLDDGGAARTFGAAIDWPRFFDHVAPVPSLVSTPLAPRLSPDVHGLIIVGPNQPPDAAGFAGDVGELARRTGWPVLADALSPLRAHAPRVPHLVTTYDTILRNEPAAERLKPDVAVVVGGWPTSKVLRAWVEESAPAVWLVSDRLDNRDALHGRTRQVPARLADVVASLPDQSATSGYERMWARYESQLRAAIDRRIETADEVVEPKAAWLLARHLPAGTPVFVANSMPVRDIEYVWPATDRGLWPLCNRGANGIDGTLSTAAGVAQAAGRPTVLLTGDLALLHDTNGFLLRPRLAVSLTVVLINNRGGGIFEHLPVARFEPPFEEFFATPQEADFARLCAAYGAEHVLVRDWPEFVRLVSELPARGIRVLEVRTDRKRDAALRKQWFAELAGLLGG
ncbi:MAG TPA: 2-succinyl-5-enolpyruvyl-6-hydroxy-3-cyclohexene-1-carboxylic-acid synthase [Opitutaceae bacterium]|nr:2-succinyl-5-enolpyruvyl-6-hydroxy-3-cyclohexene-1-carboxylic-acid synthase [Opitutaceae bacterium]